MNETTSIPAWLQLFLASLTGLVASAVVLVKLVFSFDKRLQRIENQDLEALMKAHIADDWHNNRYPMLQTRIFAALDELEAENKEIGRQMAVLIDRDRLGQRLEKIISALNVVASKPEKDKEQD